MKQAANQKLDEMSESSPTEVVGLEKECDIFAVREKLV